MLPDCGACICQQVAVLAGLGLDSPRASFTSPTGARPGSFLAPLSPRLSTAAVGDSSSLLTAPCMLAAGAVAGAVVASGGSFSMLAPPGTPGRSRFSCPGDAPPGVYSAVAADLAGGADSDSLSAPNAAYMDPTAGATASSGVLQQQHWPGAGMLPYAGAAEQAQAWTVGADGYRVPLVPVMLPAGGYAYYPADSLPTGAVVATAAQVAAAVGGTALAASDSCAAAPEGAVTLSGGISPACLDIQGTSAQLQQWPQGEQQQQQPIMGQPDVSGSATGVDGAGTMTDSVRQQAQLQSRAEAIFGQALGPPQEPTMTPAAVGDEAARGRSSSLFAFNLPLPPSGIAAQQPEAAGMASYPASSAQDNTAAATPGASGGATEPGWMGAAPADTARQSFSLWEGVLAASGHQAPGETPCLAAAPA